MEGEEIKDVDHIVESIKEIQEEEEKEEEEEEVKEERQPDLGKDENERVYLRPAAKSAFTKLRQDTLDEFKRLTDVSTDRLWKATEKDVNVERWIGTFRNCDSRKTGMRIFRIQQHVNVPRERILRMCWDFSPGTRYWDPLVDSTRTQVLEEFPKLGIQIVQWCCRVPAWSSVWGVSKRSAISAVFRGKQWVLMQHIAGHRHENKDKLENSVLLDGWSGVFVTDTGTVILIVAVNPNSNVLEPLASQLETHYLEMFKDRLKLFEQINKCWTRYYID
jgi:hypothetical protein